MDVSRLSGAKQLKLCRIYFYMGFGLLPVMWFVNAVWYFKSSFRSPPFQEQEELKRYVKLSTILFGISTVIFVGWQIFFSIWRPIYPEVADYLSFVSPLGRAMNSRVSTICQGLHLQSFRYIGRRPPKQGKPPIVPPSKKVLYHVVHVPWMKPRDVKELLWRRHAYNNTVISLRDVFKRELEVKEKAGLGLAAMKKLEDEELDSLVAQNEARNLKNSEARTKREKSEWENAKRVILEEIEKSLESERINVAERSAEVEAMITKSEEFVTLENLTDKLNHALDNPEVTDFAIDLQGKQMFNPPPVKYLEGTPTRQRGRLYDKTLG